MNSKTYKKYTFLIKKDKKKWMNEFKKNNKN